MNALDVLTRREQDILELLSEGFSDQQIAQQLVLSVGTVKWYNKQIYSKLQVKNCSEAGRIAKQTRLPHETLAAALPAHPTHNLPAQLTPFIGRKEEMAELKLLLASNRLLTITGPGGIGKTRLALHLAESQLDVFSDGVFFVPLAPLAPLENIAWTVADHINLRFNPSANAEQQLFDYLHARSLLLVLDNLEHLLSNAGLVKAMLQAAPHIKVLVTSRERLNLYGENVYPLSGMALPGSQPSLTAVDNEAVELFITSVRRNLPRFAPDESQLEQIVHICQMVGGMPLGIELAAVWVETLSLQEIAQEIEKSLDFLSRQYADVPPRHLSIRAAFDHSWRLLNNEERVTFSQLSVFRGGFTQEAAAQVLGVRADELLSLLNKSLLAFDRAAGRYQIHELLCQYAQEKLDQTGQADAISDAHMRYYAGLMERLTLDLKGAKELDILEEIEADLENIRSAFGRAGQTRNQVALEALLEPLYLFCFIRSRYQEGDELFRQARRAFAPADDDQPDTFYGYLLAFHLTFSPANRKQAEMSLRLARLHANQKFEAFALAILTRMEIEAANPSRALQFCDAGLACYQALDDRFWYAWLILQKSLIYAFSNQAEACQKFLYEALDLSRAIGALRIEANAVGNLAGLFRSHDDIPEAERHYAEAAALGERMNDYCLMAWYRGQLGITGFLKGDLRALDEAAEMTVAAARNIPEVQLVALSHVLSGLSAVVKEDYRRGKQCTEAHISHFNIFISLYAHMAYAMACCGSGDYETARRVNREFVALKWEWKDSASVASMLALEAIPLAQEGQTRRAVELLALAFTYPQTVGGWLEQWLLLNRLRLQLRSELGDTAYELAWRAGKSLQLDAVVESILNKRL